MDGYLMYDALADVRLIDQRIEKSQRSVRKVATVVQTPTLRTDTSCLVQVDGSAQPIRVLLAGIIVAAGDRVLLDYYGDQWVVTGAIVRRELGAGTYSMAPLSTGNTSSGTYGDLPTAPATTVVKMFDDTALRVEITTSSFTATIGQDVEFGVLIPEVAFLGNVARCFFNVANQHLPAAGIAKFTGIPAGTLTVKGQWLKAGGGGSCNVDNNDYFSMDIQEV